MKHILSALLISLTGFGCYAKDSSVVDALKKTYKNVKVHDTPVSHITADDKKGETGHIFLPDGTLLYSTDSRYLILGDTISIDGDLYYLMGGGLKTIVNSHGKVIANAIETIDTHSVCKLSVKGNNAFYHNIKGHKFFLINQFMGPAYSREYLNTNIFAADGRTIYDSQTVSESIEIIDAPDGLFFKTINYIKAFNQVDIRNKLLNADGKEIIKSGKALNNQVIGGKSYFISYRPLPDSQSDENFIQVFDATGKLLPDIMADSKSYIELDGHAFFILQKLNKDFGGKLTKGECYIYSPDFNIQMPWSNDDKQLAIKTENGNKILVKTNTTGKETRQFLQTNPAEVAAMPSVPQKTPAAPKPTAQSNPTQVSDIDTDIPKGNVSRPNTFALIIANENYRRIASVPFASNDGTVLSKYLNRTLGLPEKNIIMVSDASLNDISYNIERLKDICDAYDGTASVIIYYAGHGVPDDATKDAYLLPSDGYAESAAKSGFSLANLISSVEAMPTRQATILIDACFSGATREGDMLSTVRGVRLKPKENAINGNLVIISASQGDETAQTYTDQGHGLFTYFLLKKLKETKGEVTLGELSDYISTQVRRTSAVNGQKQTPSVKTAQGNATWSSDYFGSTPIH